MCLEYKNSNNIYRSGTGMMVGSCLKQLNLPFIYSVSWPRSVIDLSSQNEYNITTFMCTFTVNRKEGEGGGGHRRKRAISALAYNAAKIGISGFPPPAGRLDGDHAYSGEQSQSTL